MSHVFGHLVDVEERNKDLGISTITPITFAWQTFSQPQAIVLCAFHLSAAFGPPNFSPTITADVEGRIVDCVSNSPVTLLAGCATYQVLVEPLVSPALFVSFTDAGRK